jgi:hypothetical protein
MACRKSLILRAARVLARDNPKDSASLADGRVSFRHVAPLDERPVKIVALSEIFPIWSEGRWLISLRLSKYWRAEWC